MAKAHKVSTNNIIALCYILDEFEPFKKRLLKVISPKYNRDFVFQLWNISEGKKVLGARKARKFYLENKDIIDTINAHSNIARFINDSFGYNGETNESLEFFYEYLTAHKDELDKILEVLNKIKSLGIDNFTFNEESDFTKENYGAYMAFRRNFQVICVANPIVMPNYVEHINYRTSDSHYKLELSVTGDKLSEYGRELDLNSLIFDPSTLPDKLDTEHIFAPLLEQKQKQQQTTDKIRTSIDLSVTISDLEEELNSAEERIKRLTSIEKQQEALTALTLIRTQIEALKTISSEHNKSITTSCPTITEEILEDEKGLYLKRRYLASLDLD